MRKYLKIYKMLFANAVSYEAQYRRDTWLHLLANIPWLAMLVLTVEVVFHYTSSIAGWNKYEVYLLLMFWILCDELYTMFFRRNMVDFSDLVATGNLDILLTKPASPLFLATTKIILIRAGMRALFQAAILLWFLWQFNIALDAFHVLWASVLLAAGVMVSYAFALMLNTLSFWFIRIENINEAWEGALTVGRYPNDVLGKTLRIIAFTAIPIAFQAYVPAAAFTGRAAPALIGYTFAFTIIIFFVATRFWRFAVRRYASASS